ncbi:MAG: PepSY domain-containing protein [Clostridia bacterium]|nr:PepSY domain-containing protein [Clostridia bacterium]
MKKIISLTALVFLFVCFMTGCDMVESGERAVERGVQQVEEGASSLMNDEKAMLNEGKDMLQGDGASMNSSSPTNEEKSKFIGEEKAKEIALKKANVTTESVIFDKVELDHDDGVWRYEVDFKKDTTEYDAKINAIDGSILKWEVDNN